MYYKYGRVWAIPTYRVWVILLLEYTDSMTNSKWDINFFGVCDHFTWLPHAQLGTLCLRVIQIHQTLELRKLHIVDLLSIILKWHWVSYFVFMVTERLCKHRGALKLWEIWTTLSKGTYVTLYCDNYSRTSELRTKWDNAKLCAIGRYPLYRDCTW